MRSVKFASPQVDRDNLWQRAAVAPTQKHEREDLHFESEKQVIVEQKLCQQYVDQLIVGEHI